MNIDNTSWTLRCKSVAHKQELFAYADERGVPTLDGPLGYQFKGGKSYRSDDDLMLGWYDAGTFNGGGIMSFAGEDLDVQTPAMFKKMCDRYAAEHQKP